MPTMGWFRIWVYMIKEAAKNHGNQFRTTIVQETEKTQNEHLKEKKMSTQGPQNERNNRKKKNSAPKTKKNVAPQEQEKEKKISTQGPQNEADNRPPPKKLNSTDKQQVRKEENVKHKPQNEEKENCFTQGPRLRRIKY